VPQTVTKEIVAELIKADAEKRLVYGIVLEPDTEDTQGDIIAADEIEKAAHRFLVASRMVGDSHRKPAGAQVVESYIAPMEFNIGEQTVKAGSWVMAVKVADDRLWEAVQQGDYTGFSIGGFGARREVS
jgi:hypothetical protein